MASRVHSFKPTSILETATGSGVVTRALIPLIDSDVSYTASDLNQPMLDRARSQQKNQERVTWIQADALDLPFESRTFDIVCCQFGVMFFPDKLAGYREAMRVLKPGGHFIFNVWDHIDCNEFANVVTKVAGDVFPNDPPLFLARTPHGYHDVGQIEAELREAGFTQIQSETITAESTALTSEIPAIAYCHGTPLRNEIDARDPDALEKVTAQAAKAISTQFGSGPVSGKIQGHVFVAGM